MTNHLLAAQTALVTGASGNIGRAIARRLAEEGAAVAVHCHTAVEAAQEAASEIVALGGRATVVRGDLSDEATCHRVVREAAEWGGGRLTALVNNAAVQPVQPLPGMTAADWRAVVDTDLTSVFACTQAAAEIMRGLPGGGTVTHIASIEATHPAAGHAHYSTAKAAVVMHARAAALEYGRLGIRVNSVSPGLIDREGLAEAWPEGVRRWQEAVPAGRLGSAEDVANAVVFLASPLASWITGHDLVVDGGVSARPTW
ncbi:MAG: SDR family oxidoreductase [Streptomyces sp.]|uniref:SDR family NAD(P)-dependent oxidoreductase n=1 Tax=Streptomyces sp. TaxID=1931 RepID=UPI0025F66D5F|nr:SDR family NAD(P)-dependent oxidoreductase [Streptomyces sp.]MBW8798967.1 SDR family oxidoreductase [Streptomyces sp.]